MLQAWTPNTLPLPYSAPPVNGGEGALPIEGMTETHPAPLPPMVEVDDNFPKGRVAKFFRHQGYGFIVDRGGREIYFNLSEMDFAGFKGKESLAVGAPVGYDVSWTSNGLHVKKMKIY